MTRVDSTSGDWYATSGHFLWVGDRTRFPGSAHVELLLMVLGLHGPVDVGRLDLAHVLVQPPLYRLVSGGGMWAPMYSTSTPPSG